MLFLLLYEDDIPIANPYKNKLKELKEKNKLSFEMKDLVPW